MQTYYELAVFWRNLPPVEIQLAQLASAWGIKTPATSGAGNSNAQQGQRSSASPSGAATKQTDDEIAAGIKASGLHVFEGKLPKHLADLLADLPLT